MEQETQLRISKRDKQPSKRYLSSEYVNFIDEGEPQRLHVIHKVNY